jgi:hypothetical protein
MSTLAVNTITNAAGGNTAQINGMTPTADSLQGFRNRILNGGMVIDQRNNGAAVNSTSGGSFAVDRFKSFGNSGGVYTTQRSTDVPTGQGFVNSIVATVTTTDSPTGTDYYLIAQDVEGFNFADLQWGSASAKSVTLSFWVKSSLTGTYTAAFRNSALNRSYRAAYTVNAANTWEQKTITVPGDTTGTWLTDNGVGVGVGFTLGAGADFIDTANVWSAVEDFAATGQTQWIATSGATFYITGVQLEAGSVATPFERRPYGTELALCQRYFVELYGGTNAYQCIGLANTYNTTTGSYCIYLPVPMRTSTPSLTTAGNIYLQNLGNINISSFAGPYSQKGTIVEGDFTMASSVTANITSFMRFNNVNTSTSKFNYSAEL